MGALLASHSNLASPSEVTDRSEVLASFQRRKRNFLNYLMQPPRKEMGAPQKLGKQLLGTSLPSWLQSERCPQSGVVRLGIGQHFSCLEVSLCGFPVPQYSLLPDRRVGIFCSGYVLWQARAESHWHMSLPPSRQVQGWMDAPDQVASARSPVSCCSIASAPVSYG